LGPREPESHGRSGDTGAWRGGDRARQPRWAGSPTRAEATHQVVPVPPKTVALADRLEFVLGVGRRDGCGGCATDQASRCASTEECRPRQRSDGPSSLNGWYTAPSRDSRPSPDGGAPYLPRCLRNRRRVSSVSAMSGRATVLDHAPSGKPIIRAGAWGCSRRLSAHGTQRVSRRGTQSDTQSQTSPQSRHLWR
jgi:hypothetical protein